jgi:hypothetical protein
LPDWKAAVINDAPLGDSAMIHFSDEQLQIVRTIATPVPYARRGDFLRQLARLLGDREDPGDGHVHRAALAARQVVMPKAKPFSGLAELG